MTPPLSPPRAAIKSPITAHVLDTALGVPARNLVVRLDVGDSGGAWHRIAERVTGDDGRVTDLMGGTPLELRTYRLTFATGAYFRDGGRPAFYPRVEVFFDVAAVDQHYHIPLLVSPFGYSTYRGT
jgi:5-hydroxyisourate hydrolase